MKPELLQSIKTFLKETFFFGALVALSIYGWVRMIFYELPFSIEEDGPVLVSTVLTAWMLIASIRLVFSGVVMLLERIERNSLTLRMRPSYALPMLAVIAMIFFASCEFRASGISKDLNTGLTTKYSGIKPEDSKIIMNGEVIGHNQIPLEESFVIVHEGISGLTSKDGRVSVGCSLEIFDKVGSKLLSEADLFSGRDVFSEKEIKNLRCTVSTGKPMTWDEEYKVKVKFWDKFGNGNIEDELTISIIDLP